MLAHVQEADGGRAKVERAAGVPGWLRATMARGLAARREQRWASMDDLIRTLERGRTRPRRRALAAGAVLAVALVAFGGWRTARGGHISCAVPATRLKDRLVRPRRCPTPADPPRVRRHRPADRRDLLAPRGKGVRRVHRPVVRDVHRDMRGDSRARRTVRGRPRPPQAGLNDNLDQVRALTNVLASSDGATLGRAVAAAHDLTPVSRCGDVALLRLRSRFHAINELSKRSGSCAAR